MSHLFAAIYSILPFLQNHADILFPCHFMYLFSTSDVEGTLLSYLTLQKYKSFRKCTKLLLPLPPPTPVPAASQIVMLAIPTGTRIVVA